MATSVGEIQVVATLDSSKFKSGLSGMESDAKKSTGKIGDAFKGISNSMDSLVKDLATKGLKAGLAGAAAVGTGAVKGFSDWQQMVGGIDKLFGDASEIVQKNAARAYKTSQMSANDYMETATSFSASLIKGLGGDTAKAANIADKAIRDMSDNANTFGTSMDSIQYAYQGFAKQNYTMLDNLKLGYGGTASEMARLVNDSGVMGKNFTATAKNINDVSFDKIIEAIHVTQERMKIAGTTAKEGGQTVEGSFNQMKSAAQNFLTALGGGGDAKQAFQELIDATKQFGKNLIPVIKEILANVGELIDQYIPGFTDDVKQVFDFVKNNKDLIINVIESIAAALVLIRIGTFIGDLSSSIGNIVGAVGTLGQALGAIGAFVAANPITLVIAGIVAVVAGIVLLYNKCEWFRNAVNAVVSAIAGFIQGAISTVVDFFQGMWGLITGTISGLVGFVQTVWDGVVGIIGGIAGWVNDTIIQPVSGFITGFLSGLVAGVQTAWNNITSVIGAVAGWVNGTIIQPTINFYRGLFNAVATGVQNAWSFARGIVGGIAGWIKSNVIDRVVGFFQAGWNAVLSGVNALAGGVRKVFSTIAGVIKAPINGIIGGINSVIKKINSLTVPDWVPGIGGSHTSFPTIPKLAAGGLVQGVGSATSDSNLAWLSRGEYVMRADTVKRYGVEFMDALNDGKLGAGGRGTTSVQNYYYQFDRNANSRWQYQQVRTGAAA